MRASGSSQNPCRAAHGAITQPLRLTILVGRGVSALQQPWPETVAGADQHAPSPADPLPRRRTPVSSLRAPLLRASAGTPVRGCAGTGGRARFPYLPRVAAQSFVGGVPWRVA
jgi:hypothetical protein